MKINTDLQSKLQDYTQLNEYKSAPATGYVRSEHTNPQPQMSRQAHPQKRYIPNHERLGVTPIKMGSLREEEQEDISERNEDGSFRFLMSDTNVLSPPSKNQHKQGQQSAFNKIPYITTVSSPAGGNPSGSNAGLIEDMSSIKEGEFLLFVDDSIFCSGTSEEIQEVCRDLVFEGQLTGGKLIDVNRLSVFCRQKIKMGLFVE